MDTSKKLLLAKVGAGLAAFTVPVLSFAYDFTVTAPSLGTGSYVTMGNFVQDAPQYALDIITNNLPMFLFFLLVSLGLGIYGWLRRRASGR